MNKRELGAEMEMTALHYLEKSGYEILERNFYMRGGELDLVAIENNELCVVEVKYRRTDQYGTAAESVTRAKQLKLIKTAQFFMLKNKQYADLNVRFDVLAIDGNRLQLIKGAFET